MNNVNICAYLVTIFSLIKVNADDIKMNVQLQCPSSAKMSCRDVKGSQERVVITTSSGSKVMCDTKTDGGGWIVVQRRHNGSVDFYRGWEDYRYGFGSYDIGEFYLGNEQIFQLTSQSRYELRIDLIFKNTAYFARYSYFRLLGENENYRLKVNGYSGNANDSLTSHHNDVMFGTFDKDNARKCAQAFKGAWWYNKCHSSHLNGVWGSTVKGQGVHWSSLTTTNASATFTEMKIREVYTLK